MDADVLIVGAGPTGLMLANQLRRRGVSVLVIDRHAGPARETRALGVQARTLEIYARLGIVDQALALGKRGTGANIWAQGRRMARVPIGQAGKRLTPYPYILILGQDDNEWLMGDRLGELGGAVEWNTELVGLVQRADTVHATIRLIDGSRRSLEVAWVAGCDGAHSAVRELSGITFPGAPYEHIFFVADVTMTGGMVPDEVNVYLWRDGFHLLFPMRGADHWRIVGILPAGLRGREDLRFEDVIPSIRGEAGSDLAFRGCSWFSTYRIHHRAAARFHDRRCFLLGDAAHIHSPVGAQGMNTGLQDAYNLAWKLALVVQRRAAPGLLDTYEEERLPVARRLLSTTDRAFRLVVSDSWLAGLLRTRVLARIAAFALARPGIQRLAFRTVSQIGINYRKSSLSQAPGLPDGAPQPGDRFPWMHLKFAGGTAAEDVFERLDDTRFNLIVIGQPPPDMAALGAGDLVALLAVAEHAANRAELARVSIPPLSFFLLRPDGHIGLCGGKIEVAVVTRYLDQLMRR